MDQIKKTWKGLTKNAYLSEFFLMIFCCAVMAWYHNGADALRVIAVSVLAALAFEFLANAVFRRYALNKNSICDFPMAAYTALCVALMLPGASPVWLPVAGLLAAYLLCYIAVPLLSKSVLTMPRLRIMPSAAALAFLTVFFKKYVFGFISEATETAGSFVTGDQAALPSPARMLMDGSISGGSPYGFLDFFSGAVPGAMGATCAVVLVVLLIYLVLRRPSFSLAPLSFIAGAALWALAFPRGGAGRLQSLGFELFSGTLMFAAVFLLPVPKFLPKNSLHRLIYGFLCAVLTMLLRRIGPYEESVCVALLIMNFTVPLFNSLARKAGPRTKTDEIKNEEIVGDVPEFMKKNRTRDDILDDYLK